VSDALSNQVVGNRVAESVLDGVVVTGSQAFVDGNDSFRNGGDGFDVGGGNHTFGGNRAKQNGGYGFDLAGVAARSRTTGTSPARPTPSAGATTRTGC
jgi:hypothetical protein